MAWGRPYRYTVNAKPRADGQLSIVRVERAWKGHDRIVLSDGQEVVSRWERLTTQAEWLCQQQAPIAPRLWAIEGAVEVVAFGDIAVREPGEPSVF